MSKPLFQEIIDESTFVSRANMLDRHDVYVRAVPVYTSFILFFFLVQFF